MPGHRCQVPEPSRHDLYRLPTLRRITGPWRVLPDFIIIGAQKAGTTTLYDNLVKHPSIQGCDIKEVHFFDTNWDKGVNWYKAHFPMVREQRKAHAKGQEWITGEGSPYYMFHPLAPERVKQVCPASRLIVILRNPVDRAYSHYQHEKRKGREPLSFEEALRDEEQRLSGEAGRIISGVAASSFAHQHYSYKARGYYANQFVAWFRHFPREQFLVLTDIDLRDDFHGTFAKIFEFLGVSHREFSQPKLSNIGSYDTLDPQARAALLTHFAPHNQRLYNLLGQDFAWD